MILAFYAAGYGISYILGATIPASVVGMILLFLALWAKIIEPEWVQDTANFLIKYMVLFFIPPSIGIMVSWGELQGQLWAVIVTMVVSTIAVIVAVGVTQQILEKKLKK